jgi:hypothetical protein
MSRAERRALVESEAPALPVSRQCRLLAVSRASVCRRPAQVSEEDLAAAVGIVSLNAGLILNRDCQLDHASNASA